MTKISSFSNTVTIGKCVASHLRLTHYIWLMAPHDSRLLITCFQNLFSNCFSCKMGNRLHFLYGCLEKRINNIFMENMLTFNKQTEVKANSRTAISKRQKLALRFKIVPTNFSMQYLIGRIKNKLI